MESLAIRFHETVKRYGKVEALREVSLDIPTGQAFGLVGANGAGKTTLIKCLLDFCQLQVGNIQIFGIDHRQSSARARLAFLPERFFPPHYLTGEEFLRLVLRLHRRSYQDDQARQLAERLDLKPDALKRIVRTYSKGMTQKLGLIGCLLADKELLVLDEPMSGLDPKARERLKMLLKEAVGAGKTLFFSSHALADIDALCSHMAVLESGRLLFSGPPADFRARHGEAGIEAAYLRCVGEQDVIPA